MGLDEQYEREEQAIIDDETLTPEERNQALRELFQEGLEYMP